MRSTLYTYDTNGFVIGEKDKETAHQQGDWHRTFHLWIHYKSEGKTYQLLQIRSSKKNNYAGLIDCSAAGHYEKNEILSEGIREAREELGLQIDFSQLKFIGVRKSEISNNKEFQFVFLLERFVDLDEIKCDPNEIESFIQVENEKLLQLFTGKIEQLSCSGISFIGNEKVRKEITVKKKDFIPTDDRYFESIAGMIETPTRNLSSIFCGIRNFAEAIELNNLRLLNQYSEQLSESQFITQFQNIFSNRISSSLFLKSLTQFSHISEQLILLLQSTVDKPRTFIREKIYCIGWLRSDVAIQALKKLATHPNTEIRTIAVFVLGEICEPNDFAFLGDRINDDDDLVSQSACFSLGWNQGNFRQAVLVNALLSAKPRKKIFVEKALKMFEV